MLYISSLFCELKTKSKEISLFKLEVSVTHAIRDTLQSGYDGSAVNICNTSQKR